MKTGRLEPIDALRGIAALVVVVLFHYRNFIGYSNFHAVLSLIPSHKIQRVINFVGTYGYYGVDMFFCLSGFTFYYVYGDKVAKGRTGPGEYAVNRLSRLYPAYFAALLFAAAVKFVTNTFTVNDNPVNFFMALFFAQGLWTGAPAEIAINSVSWSLSFEMAAYALFFIITSRFRRRRYGAFTYIVPILLGLFAVQFGWKLPLLNPEGERVLVGFFIGCYTCAAYLWLSKQRKSVRVVIAVALAALALSIPYAHMILGDRALWRPIVLYQLFVFPSIVLLSLTVKPITWLLSLWPFRKLGDLSYSVYLWHYSLWTVFDQFSQRVSLPFTKASVLFLLGWLTLVIAAAFLSYRFIERPLQRRIRKKAETFFHKGEKAAVLEDKIA